MYYSSSVVKIINENSNEALRYKYLDYYLSLFYVSNVTALNPITKIYINTSDFIMVYPASISGKLFDLEA